MIQRIPLETSDAASLEAAVAAAEAAATAGDLPAALSRFGEILQRRLHSGSGRFDQTDAFLIARCADLAISGGHAAVATKLFSALFLLLRETGNHYAADLMAVKMLHVAISQGDRAAIESTLEKLRPNIGAFGEIAFTPEGLSGFERQYRSPKTTAGERTYFFCEFLLEAGRLMAWVGQYIDAAAALRRSLRHNQALGSTRRSFDAAIRLELVSVAIACADLTTAREILSELAVEPNSILAIRRQELTALVALTAGEFAHAESCFADVMEFCRRYHLIAAEATSAINLAHVLVILNRTLDAEALLTRADALASRVQDEALIRRISRVRGLVNARRTSGCGGFPLEPSNSELWATTHASVRALADAPDSFRLESAGGAGLPERLTDYTLRFYQLLERSTLATARSWLRQMHEVFGASDSALITMRLTLLDAMLGYYEGRFQAAANQLDVLRARLKQHGLRHDWWQANSVRLWCEAKLLGSSVERAGLLAESRELLEFMGSGMASESRTLFELNKWSEDESELRLRIDLLVLARHAATRRSSWAWRWLRRVSGLRALGAFRGMQALDGLVRALDERRAAPFRSQLRAQQRISWWLRLLCNPRRAVTLSFVSLPDRLFIIREGFLRFDFALVPLTRLRLRELLRRLHSALRDADRPEATRVSDELAAQLPFDSLLKVEESVRELRLVPDDVLHGFPFGLLRHRSCFLVERFAIHNDIAHVGSTDPDVRRTRHAVVAAMSLGGAGFPAIPGVLIEAEKIGARVGAAGYSVDSLLDKQATPAAVSTGLLQAGIAHIACHGVFTPDDMRRTGLVLHDGLLSLPELAELPLRQLRLISLSSCWSADNYLLPGRRVVSLPQALRHAGAGRVLSCLWPVDDMTCAYFCDRFYELRGDEAPVQALRQTQLEFLLGVARVNEKLVTDPYFWAGFVLC